MNSTATERINDLQRQILAGKEPTAEEMQAAISALRAERGISPAAKAKSDKVTKAKEIAKIDIAALFAPKEKPNE